MDSSGGTRRHKEAIDWLNEHTDEDLNFFLVRIELWKIGDSAPAPKFVVVSRPNDWTKSVRGTSHDPAELTETKLMQAGFGEKLKDTRRARVAAQVSHSTRTTLV